jgi:hypothetical protein
MNRILNEIKMLVSKLVHTTRFWNKLHQVYLKSKSFKSLWGKNAKGPKQDSQNQLKLSMAEGDKL